MNEHQRIADLNRKPTCSRLLMIYIILCGIGVGPDHGIACGQNLRDVVNLYLKPDHSCCVLLITGASVSAALNSGKVRSCVDCKPGASSSAALNSGPTDVTVEACRQNHARPASP